MSKNTPRVKRIALIDIDTLLYATSSSAEMCVKGGGLDGEDQWLQTKTPAECYRTVVNALDAMVEAVHADDAIICLSDRNNFRYRLLPTYKGNRKETRRPPMLVRLREMLVERKPYTTLLVQGLEADDLCGITSGTLTAAGKKPIICSEDKDLRTIAGSLYQKGKLEEITPTDADNNWLYQTLVGDTTDGYKGCPKVGPVKALQVLASVEGKPLSVKWARVVDEFTLRGHSYEYALTQARVARILRSTDWDPKNKDIILWTPPQGPTA